MEVTEVAEVGTQTEKEGRQVEGKGAQTEVERGDRAGGGYVLSRFGLALPFVCLTSRTVQWRPYASYEDETGR